jgi:hypothetical protein
MPFMDVSATFAGLDLHDVREIIRYADQRS